MNKTKRDKILSQYTTEDLKSPTATREIAERLELNDQVHNEIRKHNLRLNLTAMEEDSLEIQQD